MWSKFCRCLVGGGNCSCCCGAKKGLADEDSLAGSYFKRVTLPIDELHNCTVARSAAALDDIGGTDTAPRSSTGSSTLTITAHGVSTGNRLQAENMEVDEQVIKFILGLFGNGEERVACETLPSSVEQPQSVVGETQHMLGGTYICGASGVSDGDR